MKQETRNSVEDDEQLIQKAVAGDIGAFEQLVRNHQDKIYSFALSLCKNSEEAKDAAQTALLKAFLSIRGFKGRSSFTTWLYRILCNVLKDELKKSHRKHEISSDENGLLLGEALFAREEKVFNDKETRVLVARCLKQMPREFAFVVLLRDLQGFEYQEIAEILNVPLGTVKSRLARAREELRARLSRELLRG